MNHFSFVKYPKYVVMFLLALPLLAVSLMGAGTTPSTYKSNTKGNIVTSPNKSTHSNDLPHFASVSSTRAWAVGSYYDNLKGSRTRTEYWNGHTWRVVPSPNPGIAMNELSAVSASSANDVWAVGSYENSSNISSALIIHWNGKKWSVIPHPNPGRVFTFLYGVTAISTDNAWAVGTYDTPTIDNVALILHWNGYKWNQVNIPIPASSIGSFLYGISGVPHSKQVWATGNYYNGARTQTLTEKWNGHSWSIVISPSPGTENSSLDSIKAFSATNVWDFGEATYPGGPVQTLITHWNGHIWSVVPSPNPSTSENGLGAVFAASANNIWAIVNFTNASGQNLSLTIHWNGKQWLIATIPSKIDKIELLLSRLASVTIVPERDQD